MGENTRRNTRNNTRRNTRRNTRNEHEKKLPVRIWNLGTTCTVPVPYEERRQGSRGALTVLYCN